MVKRNTFAARLRSLRESRGLSVAELADRAGLNRNAIYLLEAGERSPAWDTVLRLATALDVSTEEFREEGRAGRHRAAED